MGSSPQRQVPRRQSTLPLLPFCSSLPGAADLPVPIVVSEGEGGLRGDNEDVRVPVADDVGLRQVSARQRHVHRVAVGQGG